MLRSGLLAGFLLALSLPLAGPAVADPDDGQAGSAAPGSNETASGWIPEDQRLSPFDMSNAAVNRLDPDLRAAVQDATRAAQSDGITVGLTSGWRSPEYQQQLFEEAVTRYGSAAIAAEYVASPQVSKHVVGKAVDIGPPGADKWLIAHGEQFGLCQIYANEIWHFELASDYGGTCPPLRANAAS